MGDSVNLLSGERAATSLIRPIVQAGTSIERTTRWDGRSLVTAIKLSSGPKVTQTFTKISEGLQLVVVTRVEGGHLPTPIEIKRVYDQALQVN